MYGFLAGFSSPESIFAEKKQTYFLFCNQNRKYVIFFTQIALFHINCYFIGKVSPMYGFLAGVSSPGSIFAEKILISCFVTKTENMLFFPKIALFYINCYFIGKVSPMYGFLAVLVPRNPFLLKKIFISCFVTKTGNMLFFSQKQEICYFFPKSHYFTSIVTS